MASLRLDLLGELRASLDGATVPLTTSPKQQSLLAYLALRASSPLPRAHVAAILWPESAPEQSRTNLRRELHALRLRAPWLDGLVHADRAAIGWRDGGVGCDVAEFETALATARTSTDLETRRDALERAHRLYRDELLPSCVDAWLVEERRRLHDAIVEVHERLAATLLEIGEPRSAARVGARLVELEPLLESGYVLLMRAHAGNGDRAAALDTYRRCGLVLAAELDAVPSPATRAAYGRLIDGDAVAAASKDGERPLFGRDRELTRLLGWWRDLRPGRARLVAVHGSAGIGKTRLVEELVAWASRQGVATGRSRSFAAEGRLGFAAVRDWLRAPAFAAALDGLEQHHRRELARVLPELGVADEAPSTGHDDPWRRHQLFEAAAAAVRAAATPVLLFLDDAQWSDNDSLEWIHYLLRSHTRAPLMVAVTVRSEDRSAGASTLLRELDRLGLGVHIELQPLDLDATADLAVHTLDRELSAADRALWLQATGGNPLFVIEMARAGIRPAGGSDAGEAPRELPPRLRALIAGRLVGLSDAARRLARAAATIGRAFDLALARAALEMGPTEAASAIDELLERHVLAHDLASDTFDFVHDAVREVVEAETGPAERRVLHAAVARALWRERRGGDGVAAELAMHHEHSGDLGQAIEQLERAADEAVRRAAYAEASRALTRALALLDRLPPDAERDRRELALCRALARPLNTLHGYASDEVEALVERIVRLADRLGDRETTTDGHWGAWTVRFVRGDLVRSGRAARRALEASSPRTPQRARAHHALAGTSTGLGRLRRAHRHFLVARRDAPTGAGRALLGPDVATFATAWHAHVLWLRGHIEEARTAAADAVNRAEAGHVYDRALTQAYACLTYQFMRDEAAATSAAEAVESLCTRYRIAYYGAWGRIVRGWAAAVDGRHDDGVALIGDGLDELAAGGVGARRSYHLTLLATALLAADRVEAAREALDEALVHAHGSSERWWLPEVFRVRGHAARRGGGERWQALALETALAQRSASLALRAATDLARSWAARGREAQAAALLTERLEAVHAPEDLPDAREARSLQRRLA